MTLYFKCFYVVESVDVDKIKKEVLKLLKEGETGLEVELLPEGDQWVLHVSFVSDSKVDMDVEQLIKIIYG